MVLTTSIFIDEISLWTCLFSSPSFLLPLDLGRGGSTTSCRFLLNYLDTPLTKLLHELRRSSWRDVRGSLYSKAWAVKQCMRPRRGRWRGSWATRTSALLSGPSWRLSTPGRGSRPRSRPRLARRPRVSSQALSRGCRTAPSEPMGH